MLRQAYLHHTNFCNFSSALSAQQGFLTSSWKHLYKRAPYMERAVFFHYFLKDVRVQRRQPNSVQWSLRPLSCFHWECKEGTAFADTGKGATTYCNSSSLPLLQKLFQHFKKKINKLSFLRSGVCFFFLALRLPSEDQLNGITACNYAR